MDDLWKFALYALAVGLYYFIKGRKPADKKAEADSAKPFMSPAANTGKQTRPNPVSPEGSTSLEDLLRRFAGEGQTTQTKPEPMLKDNVRQARRKLSANEQSRSLEGASLEEIPDARSLETVPYDNVIPQYKNEASDVDYEIPEKAQYKGLDKSGTNRFKEFDSQPEKLSRYAALLKNADSVRDAFVLGEIFRRKEF